MLKLCTPENSQWVHIRGHTDSHTFRNLERGHPPIHTKNHPQAVLAVNDLTNTDKTFSFISHEICIKTMWNKNTYGAL